jgi:DNA-binding GntR family transcriptional regulator
VKTSAAPSGPRSDLLELRVVLERQALRALCHRAATAGLHSLTVQCTWDRQDSSRGLLDETAVEARFHRLLLEAAHDPALSRLGESLLRLGAPVLGPPASACPRAVQATIDEHSALVDALWAGRLQEATGLLEAHLYRRAVLELLVTKRHRTLLPTADLSG